MVLWVPKVLSITEIPNCIAFFVWPLHNEVPHKELNVKKEYIRIMRSVWGHK